MQFIGLHPGKTVEKCPINSFKTDTSSNNYVYILAGIHGDDLSGVYVLHHFFAYLKQSHNDLPLVIFPILNVDGHRFGTQKNSHGIDLFSDMGTSESEESKSSLSQPETKYFLKMLDKYPPALILLFHPNENSQYIGRHHDVISNFFKQVKFRPEKQSLSSELNLQEFLNLKFKTSVLSINCPPPKKESSLQNIWEHLKENLISFINSKEIKLFLDNNEDDFNNETDNSSSSYQNSEVFDENILI